MKLFRNIWSGTIFLLGIIGHMSAQEIVLNEMLSSNASVLQDEDGDYPDWIELYNTGNDPVNIGGYRISDNLGNPDKWMFPEVWIEGHSTLLIYASGKDRIVGPNLHTNFSIKAEGEVILLSDANGDVIDYWPPVEPGADKSYGRYPDGADEFEIFSVPTPNLPNALGEIYVPLTETVFFSSTPGFYAEGFQLVLTCSHPEATIHYTRNGRDPTPNDPGYVEPLTIDDNAGVPNGISSIPTNTAETYTYWGWKPPVNTVFKGTVIKASAFIGDEAVSPVTTASYFVDPSMEERYGGLPVVSLSLDSLHMFGYETGIYVPGTTHDDNPDLPLEWGYGNYNMKGKEWERSAHFEFFEPNGELSISQGIGVRIHGGGTRQLSLKSLRLYARYEYGSRYFNYAFFPWKPADQYRRILLRPSGNDFDSNFCADAVSSVISGELNVLKQEVRPAVLFINGEFWGIHNIRDRIDNYFLEYSTGADPDNVDVIENWMEASEGSMSGYNELVSFIESADLSYESNYESVAEKVDISSIIDYYILKQFIAVHDWPGNNNSFWRSTSPDSKWHWINYDSDGAFRTADYNPIPHSLIASGEYFHQEISVVLFKNLMENTAFREAYYHRFVELMQTVFKPENVVSVIDSLTEIIAPTMEEHVKRWQFPASLEAWEEAVQVMRDFAYQRPCFMLQYLINHLSIHPSDYPSGICDNIFAENNLPDNLVIWPNPAVDQLNIKLRDEAEFRQVLIFDASGREVFSQRQGLTKFVGQLPLSVGYLSSGIYVLHVETEYQLYTKRFVVSNP